jgi:hypothetical protein
MIKPTRLLFLLILSAWGFAPAAAAEEERHKEAHEHQPAPPARPQTPALGGIVSGPAAPAPAPAQPAAGNSGSGQPSLGEQILWDLFFGSSGSSDSAASSSYTAATPSVPSIPLFNNLYVWLDANSHVAYGGAGVGNVIIHYPASSSSDFGWEFFAGVRKKYWGIEAGFDRLRSYDATINAQVVSMRTDLYSLSLLGILPLSDSADFYLRYGTAYWSVDAASAGTVSPVMSGTNQLTGVGIELRQNDNFLRIETKVFRHVYQSNGYSYTGLSVGGYFN